MQGGNADPVTAYSKELMDHSHHEAVFDWVSACTVQCDSDAQSRQKSFLHRRQTL